jgi:hypothetical protein
MGVAWKSSAKIGVVWTRQSAGDCGVKLPTGSAPWQPASENDKHTTAAQQHLAVGACFIVATPPVRRS